MQRYVIGFAIDTMLEEVLLIKKLKPDWQAGHLNGIGGKCGATEQAYRVMTREFYEETGIHVCWKKWQMFCTTKARDGEVHFFVVFINKTVVEQTEAEEPVWVNYKPLPSSVIDNLHWLIPMALAKIPVIATVIE